MDITKKGTTRKEIKRRVIPRKDIMMKITKDTNTKKALRVTTRTTKLVLFSLTNSNFNSFSFTETWQEGRKTWWK